MWVLALVTLAGSMSMHIFVPALPAVASAFHAGHALAQLTLSAYVVGLAAAQLVYGALSDRFGRRPVLMFAMTVYGAASLLALSARSIEILIAARLLQGAGAGGGMVLGRAIVRDSYTGVKATSMLSLLNLFVLLAPGLSPLLGSVVTGLADWRSIFVILAGLAIVNVANVYFLLSETAPAVRTGFGQIVANYGRLLRNRSFRGFALAGGCATTSLYAFIGAAPFIIAHQLHRPADEIGFYLAFNIVGMAIGSIMARRWIGLIPNAALLRAGNALSAAGAAIFLAAALSDHLTLTIMLGAMLIFTIGAGAVSPITMAEALAVDPRVAGSSSGLYGAIQMSIGAVSTALAGIGSSPALAAGAVMLAGTCVTQLCIRSASRASTHPVRSNAL